MRGILVLAVLGIKSSYSRSIELPLADDADVPDTLQWWFGGGGCWRIRTYALDHDIHTYIIGASLNTTLELAKENNLKHYGDVIKLQHVIHFADCADCSEVQAEFERIGLAPRMEISAGRYAFWKPDDAPYWTKSAPANESV